jgi:DNA-binding response OmpR family regulator
VKRQADGKGGSEAVGKILVVDDDQTLTQALGIRLKAAGFEVVAVHCGETASRTAMRERPDLILLDIDMPHFSGLELHECLRNTDHGRDIPVIYLSGNDSEIHRAEAYRQGARAFVSKPYDPAKLIKAIRTALARSAGAPA